MRWFPPRRKPIRVPRRILSIVRGEAALVVNSTEVRAVPKQFLEETNFADDAEENQPETNEAEKRNQAIRATQERMWSDANLRDGSY